MASTLSELININDDVKCNGKRMLSTIVIICCLHKLTSKFIKITDVPLDGVSIMLSLLRLKPDMQHQQCEDWVYLDTCIPDAFRKTAIDAVCAFTNYLCQKKLFNEPNWLFAIPVVHFLRRASKPFQEVELDYNKVPWEDQSVDIVSVKKRTQGSKNSQ